MKILDTRSLLATIDNFNEAVFSGRDWIGEAGDLVDWLQSRLGKPGGYLDSFALTSGDWSRECRLFTGERLTTRAGRAHVIAEETNRVLRIIKQEAGLDVPSLEESEARLGERIFHDCREHALETGEFCCATCSVALWRYMSAGGFPGHPDLIKPGLRTLRGARSATGGWNRFPFYYTMLFLSECPENQAGEEMRFHVKSCQRRLRILEGRKDRHSRRKRDLLTRILAGQATSR